MPWTEKQQKLFRAAAHNTAIAKGAGMTQAQAKKLLAEGKKDERRKKG